MFTCEFSEISKNTFFYRTPLVAASEAKELSQRVRKMGEKAVAVKSPENYVGKWKYYRHVANNQIQT